MVCEASLITSTVNAVILSCQLSNHYTIWMHTLNMKFDCWSWYRTHDTHAHTVCLYWSSWAREKWEERRGEEGRRRKGLLSPEGYGLNCPGSALAKFYPASSSFTCTAELFSALHELMGAEKETGGTSRLLGCDGDKKMQLLPPPPVLTIYRLPSTSPPLPPTPHTHTPICL